MKLHQKVALHIVAQIILASFATATFASCVRIQQGPPCQEYWRADAVFIGTATRVVAVRNKTQLAIGPYIRVTTHFSVEEAFKGIEGTVVVFDSNTTDARTLLADRQPARLRPLGFGSGPQPSESFLSRRE